MISSWLKCHDDVCMFENIMTWHVTDHSFLLLAVFWFSLTYITFNTATVYICVYCWIYWVGM